MTKDDRAATLAAVSESEQCGLSVDDRHGSAAGVAYDALFDAHPLPVAVVDPANGRFLAVNQALAETYGYSRDELLGLSLDDLVADSDAGGRYHRRSDGAILEVESYEGETEFDGAAARLLILRDVTAERRQEQRVRETEKREAVGQLAGGVAHDLNNLLLVVRGYSGLLVKQVSDNLRESVEEIDTAAQRAALLVQQLLAVSRQQMLDPQERDLNAIVEDALQQVRVPDEVELELSLEDDAGAIVVDRSRLTQTVLSLVVNACDAMPDGGSLRIRTAHAELDVAYALERDGVEPGSYELLEIADTGFGMDDHVREHAFEPFFTTKGFGGGLGLATAEGLVKQSGGHIALTSAPGIGTTLELYFPTAERSQVAVSPPAKPVAARGGETVLVVDDTDAVRRLVTVILGQSGYRVLEAVDGREAIELVKASGEPVDLLLTDVVMPGMAGGALASALKELDPDLKVLFTSGYPSDVSVRRGIAEASAAFIEKPYTSQALAEKVRQVLDQGTPA
jgi:signal transduction histidine kinase/ActR/RegA family two-component response regulator